MPAAAMTGPRRRTRRSLVEVWLERAPHPLVTLAIVGVLETAAVGGLTYWAGWRSVLHALSIENATWFGLCGGGQVVAYLGYALSLKAAVSVEGGVEMPFPVSLAVVSVGFGSMFSASMAGGFSVDYLTLQEAGMSRRRALQRVIGLSFLEYAILAPAVAVCGLLLYLGIGGSASAELTLPWLAVVPGVLAAAWITSPRRGNRFDFHAGDNAIRRGIAHLAAALGILRSLVSEWRRYGWAFLGASLYWAGDIVTFWAALRVFDVRLSVTVLVLAYGTGWALTRRSLPFGGPGVVEVLLAWVLTWFHVRFAPAAAGVVAYRLFNFWLALIPAAGVMPFTRQLERSLVNAAEEEPGR